MRADVVDPKIGERLARARDPRPHTRVSGLERTVGESGPVAANGRVERGRAARIHPVVAAVHPLDVGSEARAAPEVEGEVYAEAARVRQGVDQSLERRAPLEREVTALDEVRRRDLRRGKAFHQPRYLRRLHPGAVDERPGSQRGLRSVHADECRPVREHHARDRAAAGEACAAALRIPEQRQHAGLRIDDAGERGVKRRGARELRLERLSRRAVEPRELDAVGLRRGGDAGEARQLGIGRGDDELFAAPVGNGAPGAEPVEPLTPSDAQAGLERARRIVDAGVDHLAVARTRPRAEARGGFEDQHLASGERQLPRHREAHDAGPDHHRIDLIHGAASVAAGSP